MMSANPLTWNIAQLRAAFAARTLSPVELVQLILEDVGADQRRINAFVSIDPQAALLAARESEARYGQGRPLGPLDGVPSSIKDLLNLRGWPTRRGSLATEGDAPAADDSPVAALLRRAGSPILGKTTTSEFGWAPISESPHTGITRNPLDPDRSAGGSSSGAAAQVAAHWGPLAIGSDAGGSVRVPAAYCGLVGFKPTHGAIPQAPLSALGDFSHVGPITRCVDDCVLAMQVLAAPDLRDPTSLFPRASVPALQRPLRIGWAGRFGHITEPDPAIAEALESLVGTLRTDGLQIEPVDFSWLEASDALWQVWAPRIFESFQAMPESRRALLDPRIQRIFEQGRDQGAVALAQGRTRLREMAVRITSVFETLDLVLTPTAPSVALLHGDLAPRGHPLFDAIALSGNNFDAHPYCYPFNVTQQPALSMPLGRNAEGLPFGLQIVGRKFHDAQVLEFARVVERALSAH